MISDALFDAINEIEDYQRDCPELYEDIRDPIEVVKKVMASLVSILDAAPDSDPPNIAELLSADEREWFRVTCEAQIARCVERLRLLGPVDAGELVRRLNDAVERQEVLLAEGLCDHDQTPCPSHDKGIEFHHVVSGTTKGWVHTHGMDRFGLPELEIRAVPGYLVESAAGILKSACDYMIDSGKKVSVGETMALSNRTISRFAKGDPIPGAEDHYEEERWEIVETERLCECCRSRMADCNYEV